MQINLKFYNKFLFTEFPAGILQGAFFNNDRPRYMNYGAIGFVMGHEITHGFDDQGRQFDKDGNLVDWWAEETKKQYLKRAECIIQQYGNYTDVSVGLNVSSYNCNLMSINKELKITKGPKFRHVIN